MSKKVAAIEYIRGIAMLGVVGIHTGAYSLSNPGVNIHLFALLEIFTRFSVPIFFFVSAFGLFWNYRPDAPFSYGRFIIRRFRTVLVPYITWSILYMAHYSWLTDSWYWTLDTIFRYFFFGLASYQLYFLVILTWFYLLMPLWRALMPLLLRHTAAGLAILFAGQLAFNCYSSYFLLPGEESTFANLLIQHRMSYLVLHYLFTFLLGAVCAVRFGDFTAALARYRAAVAAFFAASLGAMLGAYYYLLHFQGYQPADAVNTIHQLSPPGVFYTLAACLFFFSLFHRPLPPRTASILAGQIGRAHV